MDLMVINNFSQVAVTIGRNCVHNVYNSLGEALDAVSKAYHNTLWSEVDDDVRFYGWVTEGNGYQHTQGSPILKLKASAFWGGRKPRIKEIRRQGA